MEGCSSILDVDVVSSLEIGHHAFRESHIKVSFDRILDITLVKVRVSIYELHLEFVNELIYLLIAPALPRCLFFAALLELNFDLCVFLIQLISSDHECFVLWACKSLDLNPFYELLRNIGLVVVALLAGTHFNLPHSLYLFVVIV